MAWDDETPWPRATSANPEPSRAVDMAAHGRERRLLRRARVRRVRVRELHDDAGPRVRTIGGRVDRIHAEQRSVFQSFMTDAERLRRKSPHGSSHRCILKGEHADRYRNAGQHARPLSDVMNSRIVSVGIAPVRSRFSGREGESGGEFYDQTPSYTRFAGTCDGSGSTDRGNGLTSETATGAAMTRLEVGECRLNRQDPLP